MSKALKVLPLVIILIATLLLGCENNKDNNNGASTINKGSTNNTTPTGNSGVSVDYATIKPNENGKIMVAMFHNFVESFIPTKYDVGEYTTTFSEFRKLLQNLYDMKYRLINLNDYLNNNINVAAGYIPMVFTFDDGVKGQFNLVNQNGQLVANPNSAVGIMEEFNKQHPDFGLKGTFYVNLGIKTTFDGEGTMPQRLQYLIDKGFEIGNHTYTHIHLNEVKSADKIQQEIGQNQAKMYEYIPGYQMKSLALPFGQASKSLQKYVIKGEYKGTKYENLALMNVGWDPNVSSVDTKFNPYSIHRVRASGIKPVVNDLDWWLKNISKREQYISGGDINTVAVPKSKADTIDKSKLGNKKLITY